MKRAPLITLLLLGSLSAVNSARAVDYPLPPAGSRLIGQNQTYTIQEGDNKLQSIARRFNTAAQLILETNNTIAPVNPAPGTVITIPSQMLLPDTEREGIVVNLAELRLYFYPPGENIVQVYPLGIGQLGLETPVSTTRVSQKIPNPTWTPTAGIRARSLAQGIKLPPVVPAGPNNPLGRFALRLGIGNGEYLIHGTSAPDSVGLRVSSGCMRMNAPDIKALFEQVRVGTRVQIINEPVKFSVEPDGKRWPFQQAMVRQPAILSCRCRTVVSQRRWRKARERKRFSRGLTKAKKMAHNVRHFINRYYYLRYLVAWLSRRWLARAASSLAA